jgi:hypothetical protein
MQTELPISLTLPLSTVNTVLSSLNEAAARAQAAMQDIGTQTQGQVQKAQADIAKAQAAADPDRPPILSPAEQTDAKEKAARAAEATAKAAEPVQQPPQDVSPIAAAAAQAVDTPAEPNQ